MRTFEPLQTPLFRNNWQHFPTICNIIHSCPYSLPSSLLGSLLGLQLSSLLNSDSNLHNGKIEPDRSTADQLDALRSGFLDVSCPAACTLSSPRIGSTKLAALLAVWLALIVLAALLVVSEANALEPLQIP